MSIRINPVLVTLKVLQALELKAAVLVYRFCKVFDLIRKENS